MVGPLVLRDDTICISRALSVGHHHHHHHRHALSIWESGAGMPPEFYQELIICISYKQLVQSMPRAVDHKLCIIIRLSGLCYALSIMILHSHGCNQKINSIAYLNCISDPANQGGSNKQVEIETRTLHCHCSVKLCIGK